MKKTILIIFMLSVISSGGLCYAMSWEQVNGNGLDNTDNISFYPGVVFNDYLFMGSNNPGNGGELWKTSDGVNFSSITINGFGDAQDNQELVPAHHVFANHVYVFTKNAVTGTQVWRSPTGNQYPGDWTKLNDGGFGDMSNQGIWSSCIEGGWMYVGTTGDGASEVGAYIYKSSGTVWTFVTNAGSSLDTPANESIYNEGVIDGYFYCGTYNNSSGGNLWRSPDMVAFSSITINGFGDPNNWRIFPAYQAFNGYLYAGTRNDVTGAELWRSPDGVVFSSITTGGFGDSANADILSFSMPGDGFLYVSTENGETGTEVWRSSTGAMGTWEQTNNDGFGDTDNCHSWLSRTLLSGYFFAGTYNDMDGANIYKVFIDTSTDDGGDDPVVDDPVVDDPIVTEEPGEVIVVGPSEGEGIVNPNSGAPVDIYFKSDTAGEFTCRIFTVLGELVYEERKNSLSEGTFSWIPSNIASGMYIVHVKGPGIDIHKKIAILK